MAKYSKAAGKKVETAMKEMKKGKLKTGSGKKITDKKQAVAIGLSEARQKGLKVPAKAANKKAAPAKKAAVKKAAAAKKATAPKKVAAKKATPSKKSAAPKKAASAKKTIPAKKAVAQKKEMPKAPAPARKKPEAPATPDMNYPPVEENSPMEAPVTEPTPEGPVLTESTGAPIPEDQYAVARDTYHKHTKPTASKSKIRPTGKKPLWS